VSAPVLLARLERVGSEDPNNGEVTMADQADEQVEESGGDVEETQDEGIAGAVDDRAAELTGSSGAAATDLKAADNRGPVADAEQHLEENTDLADDRETLKKIQQQM
jgi:hypothetical protein